MNRQDYNRKILEKLKYIIETCPYLRFGQILVDTGIIQLEECLLEGQRETILTGIDPFYEESEITWKRMSESKL